MAEAMTRRVRPRQIRLELPAPADPAPPAAEAHVSPDQAALDLAASGEYVTLVAFRRAAGLPGLSPEGLRAEGRRVCRFLRPRGLKVKKLPDPVWRSAVAYPEAALREFYGL